MTKQAGFLNIEERLAEISAGGEPLELLDRTLEFGRFRPILERVANRPRGAGGGQPAMNVVLKFRMLMLQRVLGLSLEPTGKMVRDRLSWMRFCRLGIADTVPDANTHWE